jgi:[ribosomal protein S18]-alanine N-acetyltransferase
MEYTLQPATLADLRVILTWITSPDSLKLWGGPSLTYPSTPEQIWQEIGASSENAFSLVDPAGVVVGFGQTFLREPGSVHLGRIIVSPARRGQGLGRILCQELIQSGSIHCRPARFTLNVYKDNMPAFTLYTSLGFSVLSEDPEQNMVRMARDS